MTTSSSSKKKAEAKPAQENPVAQQENKSPPIKSKKRGSEIDEIFAAKKRKKHESKDKRSGKESAIVAKSGDGMQIKRKSKSKAPKERTVMDAPSKERKKTADGLTVYTEEELGIGKPDAGGTRLCPFDCDCCF